MDCGGCTMCCRLMLVEELCKPANTWCAHCKPGNGCSIYESRPQECVTYECLWLKSQRRTEPMVAELRPDRSRVILNALEDDSGVRAHVHPDYPDAWKNGRMGKLLADAI